MSIFGRAELESLFESLPGLYLVLTPDFTIIAASDAYLKATMTAREDILGRGLFEVFPDNPTGQEATGVKNLRLSLQHVLEHAEPHSMAIQRYDIRQPDGVFVERYWSPINSPVLDANRKVKYLIHRVEDVTTFVKQSPHGDSLEEQTAWAKLEAEMFTSSERLQEANRLLEAANKELESFSYSVSHDLRTPLRTIDGFSQAVIDDFGEQLPDEGKRYLHIIREGAQRMGALIDALLTLSRLSRTPLQIQKVETSALVRDLLDALIAQAKDRKIECVVRHLPDCEADPTLLRQIWSNLLSNALKYTRHRASTRIEVGSEASAEGDIFFVRDNGAGFDMRYADKLFGAFQRLHRAEDYEGTGVGLAIVQRLIHRHGGHIQAEAAVDQGATFSFSLGHPPARRSQA